MPLSAGDRAPVFDPYNVKVTGHVAKLIRDLSLA